MPHGARGGSPSGRNGEDVGVPDGITNPVASPIDLLIMPHGSRGASSSNRSGEDVVALNGITNQVASPNDHMIRPHGAKGGRISDRNGGDMVPPNGITNPVPSPNDILIMPHGSRVDRNSQGVVASDGSQGHHTRDKEIQTLAMDQADMEVKSSSSSIDRDIRTLAMDQADMEIKYHPPSGWEDLTACLLSKVFSYLNFWDRARASTVCCHWNLVFHQPELWRRFDFEVTQETTSYLKSTPKGLIKQVLQQHQEHLRFVSFSIDAHPKSAEVACDILSQMVNCSLKTLELMSSAKPTFMLDKDKFVSALNVVVVSSPHTISSLALSETPVDDPSLLMLAKTHQDSLTLLDIESCPNASSRGITVIADHCRKLHQLTIDYSHLSEELLSALCRDEHVTLKFLKLNITKEDAQEQFHPIGQESWALLARHSPNLKLVMNFYVLDHSDYEVFFNFEMPVTHLYFGRYVSQEVLGRVGRHCHRLNEMVICANGNIPLDRELLQIAVHCKNLESLGLGECEVHCAAIVKIAKICGKQLTQLFIREEVLLEDEQFSIDQMIEKVSTYLGRDWSPELMPYWD